MKIATIIIRSLFGALFIFVYLMPLAKTVELLCGLAYISGKFVTLANIVILPVSLNILLINYFLSPETLPIAIFVFLGNLFLIYRYWDNYKSVFTM